MILPLTVLVMIAAALPARAEHLYLVIGATDRSPAGIAKKAKAVSNGGGLIFRISDCGDGESIYAWAERIEPTADSARTSLRALKERVPDAYVKECLVKRGSLLAHRIPAVDPSIADVPATAVNWDESDMVTRLQPLPHGRSLVISRYFESAADDPLEGKRERVLLLDSTDKAKELEKNCLQAAGVTAKGKYLAFQCAREVAGDHLLHSVSVFEKEGSKVKEVRHCRTPQLLKGRYLQCQHETVGADGVLKLREIKIKLH